MRYSINSRFRGSLVGATVEEVSQPSQAKPDSIAKVIIPGAQSLIALGRFERENWLEKLLTPELTPLQAIIATLPLALFYHDNKTKLRQNLLSVTSIWQKEPLIEDSILAFGYAIAQALIEKLSPSKLIPQIAAFLEPSTILSAKLLQVQALLAQKAGIERTISQITPNSDRLTISIALGFYYFLSTPEDFYLSMKRSGRSPFACSAIVGALSGAYNSASSIPSSWQTTIVSDRTSPRKEVLELSDSLVAVWSGVYDSKVKLLSTAVAAPRVIRSR